MASQGKKRNKAFYRKSAYGGKKHCPGINILKPDIKGFLVMCHNDERSAVRECYNILNEYADNLYGPDKSLAASQGNDNAEEEDECEEMDIEKALKKEVEELNKANKSTEKRFQNVATKAKNCVFIRTALENPIELIVHVMEEIAEKHLKRARYAARILPIIGTCKATTKDIEKLASEVLAPIFSKESANTPTSCTVLFKMRNNQGTACGRESVIPAVTKIIKDINPDVKFSWTDYSVAVVIEVVCTVCCIGLAPDYIRLRKYNLQELSQGPKDITDVPVVESVQDKTVDECVQDKTVVESVQDKSIVESVQDKTVIESASENSIPNPDNADDETKSEMEGESSVKKDDAGTDTNQPIEDENKCHLVKPEETEKNENEQVVSSDNTKSEKDSANCENDKETVVESKTEETVVM